MSDETLRILLIIFFIFCGVCAIIGIGMEIYTMINYANMPISEMPVWLLWFLK